MKAVSEQPSLSCKDRPSCRKSSTHSVPPRTPGRSKARDRVRCFRWWQKMTNEPSLHMDVSTKVSTVGVLK